jgi:hypothetical protein
MEGSGSVQIMMYRYPDRGGLKTYGSYGSGSGSTTLTEIDSAKPGTKPVSGTSKRLEPDPGSVNQDKQH